MRPSSLLVLAVLLGACRSSEALPPPSSEPSVAASADPGQSPGAAGEPASPSSSANSSPSQPSPNADRSPAPDSEARIATDEPEPSDGGLAPLEPKLAKKFERPSLPEPSGPIKPSRIKVGEYKCKISREYRFRPCTVSLDEHGRSILTVPTALINIEGVLTDDGKVTRFDGILTAERPFGCFSCQERCSIDPNSCFCKEMPPEHSAECMQQPIRFGIRKKDGQWRSRIEHRVYYGDVDDEGNPRYDTNKYVFVMRR